MAKPTRTDGVHGPETEENTVIRFWNLSFKQALTDTGGSRDTWGPKTAVKNRVS